MRALHNGRRNPLPPSKGYTMKNWLLSALTLPLLCACAARPSVVELPPPPKPKAPQAALQPIPPAGYFLKQWHTIFTP